MSMSWDNPVDCTVVGLDLTWEMEEKMVRIRKNLKVSQGRKKRCADKDKTHREFGVGDHVFMKVKAKNSSLKLGNF
jgi:hypothetical protein